MTRDAKPGLPRAVDGPIEEPQRFWGGSVKYNGEKVEIALYLAVFVTREREGYAKVLNIQCFEIDLRVPVLGAPYDPTGDFLRF